MNGKGFLLFNIVSMLFFSFYLSYHIFFNGYNSLLYNRIENIELNKNIELQRLQIELQNKKNKVDRLKTDNLDLDLFEEEFRKNFSFIHENEIVVFWDDVGSE